MKNDRKFCENIPTPENFQESTLGTKLIKKIKNAVWYLQFVEQFNVSRQRTGLVGTSVVGTKCITTTGIATDIEDVASAADGVALYVILTLQFEKRVK